MTDYKEFLRENDTSLKDLKMSRLTDTRPELEYIPFLLRKPGPDTHYFRDNKMPSQSLDHVFTALLLENWYPLIAFADIFRDPEGNYACYMADRSGGHWDINSGLAVSADGLVLKSRLKRSTICSYLRKGYYFFRNNVMNDGYQSSKIIVDGSVIVSEGVVNHDNKRQMNDLLKWKFDKGNDIGMKFEKHINLSQIPGDPPATGDQLLVCPVDGYVKPILAEIKSPEETWRNLCGRHWVGPACPHCLGLFYIQLWMMS